MTPEESSDQKQVWPKRTPDQHQLFASVDKWLAFLPYLTKPELNKCREVCEWTDWLIEKHSGGKLKQRHRLRGIFIAPVGQNAVSPICAQHGKLRGRLQAPYDYPGWQMTPLDLDKWVADEQEMEKIKAKAQKLIGETIYLYEPEDATVRISIAPRLTRCHLPGRFLYLDVKNRLDEKDALLIARLMPRITPPMAVFLSMVLMFDHTPQLPSDAPHGGSYFNPALFSLPGNDADGDPVKLITWNLSFESWDDGDERGMIRTAELSVQCQELFFPYHWTRWRGLVNFLAQVAQARPLNVPAKITADDMEDGLLNGILEFFIEIPTCESAVPRLRVTIDNPTSWPESLPKTNAINSREEQLAKRLYKFQLYNRETGEKLDVEVRGSFGKVEDEGKGEAGLRVSEMVLYFRSGTDDK